MYHIQDKVVLDVYMLRGIIEHGIPQQSNNPLVVTEDHDGIQHMSKQLIEELPQPDSFTGGHIAMYPASSVLKATDFCFLLIQDIEVEPKENYHSKVLL